MEEQSYSQMQTTYLLYGFPIKNKKCAKNSDFEDTIIKHVVSFILHKDHVVTTLCGEKTLYLGPDESIILPTLCKKLRPKELWENYACTT